MGAKPGQHSDWHNGDMLKKIGGIGRSEEKPGEQSNGHNRRGATNKEDH